MYFYAPTVVNTWTGRVCATKPIRNALVGGVSHCSFIKSQRRLQITPPKSHKLGAQMKDRGGIHVSLSATLFVLRVVAKRYAESVFRDACCTSSG